MSQKIAVIGGGPSGLCSLRHLSKHPDKFEVVAFEKRDDIGGIWLYTDYTDKDEYGLPCYATLYKSLTNNVPKELMGYPDYDFPEHLPSFMSYTEIKKYLDSYTDHFDLRKYIKFQTLVTNVKPTEDSNGRVHWLVTTRDLKEDLITTSVFDAVLICNGKFADPNMPEIAGQDTFKGQILHSKNYRDKEDFRGKTALVLGASFSGKDIALDLSTVTPKVYLAHTDARVQFKLPENVEETVGVTKILPNGVILSNGECREVDVIIFATGYHFMMDFVSEECGLTLKDDRITHLYSHIVNIKYPTMLFIGMIKRVLELQLSNVQAQYACALLRGEIELPSKTEMLQQEEEDYQKRVVALKLHPKMTHDLFGPEQEVYFRKLEAEAKLTPLKQAIFKIFDRLVELYGDRYDNFLNVNFKFVGDDDFIETET